MAERVTGKGTAPMGGMAMRVMGMGMSKREERCRRRAPGGVGQGQGQRCAWLLRVAS